jgi:hypothetical protein
MIRPRRAAILASCGCPCVNSAFLLGMLGEGGAGPSAGNLKGPSERGGGIPKILCQGAKERSSGTRRRKYEHTGLSIRTNCRLHRY